MNILFKENEFTFGELRKRLDSYIQKRILRKKSYYNIFITEKGIDEFTKLRERLFEVLK